MIFGLSGCVNVNKQLNKKTEYKDKYLLYHQKIKGNSEVSYSELSGLYAQKTNRKLLFRWYMPYLHTYLYWKRPTFLGFIHPYDTVRIQHQIEKYKKRHLQLSDTNQVVKDSIKHQKKINRNNTKLRHQSTKLKEGNWFMRTVGEPPALYDTSALNVSVETMKAYLNNKGYFGANVSYSAQTGKKWTTITYHIDEGKPHKISQIQYQISDSAIYRLYISTLKNSLLTTNTNFDINTLASERERIYRYLKNNGYFQFQRQYINFEVDTNIGNKKVSLSLVIDPPFNQPLHTRFKVSKVVMTIDPLKPIDHDTLLYKKITFIQPGKKYSKKLLAENILIKPDSWYNQSNTEQTQRQLGGFDIFKYVNVNYQAADSGKLIAYLSASTLKKFQFTTETGMNVNFSLGQSLPGPFVNLGFINRKVFRGFEIFSTNIRYSLENQPAILDQKTGFRTQEIGINSGLTFPKLLIPTAFKYRFSKYNPSTRITIGYTDLSRIEFDRTNLNASMRYDIRVLPNRSYFLTPIDLNLIRPTIKRDEFQQYLDTLKDNGNNLFRSFIPSVISTLQIGYMYNDNDITVNKKAKYFRIVFEEGGLLPAFTEKYIVKSYNSELKYKLPYYQFNKLSSDFRYYVPISAKGTVVFRVNSGVAKPYGNHEETAGVLPYEKYFFSGGLNSIRAWQPRRLGPGGYVRKNENGEYDYRFEQPGEILFESNMELRSRIIGVFHGAAFLDIGNVWTFKADQSRPLAEFNVNTFYKQLAVGSGVGFRFDFSFLILRFDIGVKVWDPGRQAIVPLRDPFSRTYNLGIGYPF